MSVPFPDPTAAAGSRAEVFTRYLDYFRDRLAAKLRALPEGELRVSRLPSAWTPLELLKHLTFVELRWLEWGFEGRAVADPWGDRREDRWYVAPDESLDGLLASLEQQARRSRAIIGCHDLGEVGQPGERWAGESPATLERVLFHLVQEYARHLGHLDIVAELAGAAVGELLVFADAAGQAEEAGGGHQQGRDDHHAFERAERVGARRRARLERAQIVINRVVDVLFQLAESL
jgi:uncharacterized damage-inducible protein DinB